MSAVFLLPCQECQCCLPPPNHDRREKLRSRSTQPTVLFPLEALFEMTGRQATIADLRPHFFSSQLKKRVLINEVNKHAPKLVAGFRVVILKKRSSSHGLYYEDAVELHDLITNAPNSSESDATAWRKLFRQQFTPWWDSYRIDVTVATIARLTVALIGVGKLRKLT